MKVLLDTHLLVWATARQARVPAEARKILEAADTEPFFSVASLWEIAIKTGLGRPEFQIDPRIMRRGLIDSGYLELEITSAHVLATSDLPLIHRDPFDRLLVAQASVEGFELLTADKVVGRYPGPIRYLA